MKVRISVRAVAVTFTGEGAHLGRAVAVTFPGEGAQLGPGPCQSLSPVKVSNAVPGFAFGSAVSADPVRVA